MKYTKKIIYLFFIVAVEPMAMGVSIGKEAAKEFNNGLNQTMKEAMPALAAASAGVGAKFGTEAVAMIGAGITKTGVAIGAVAVKAAAAIKAGAIIVATAPATPYVVGGGVITGVGYKAYRHYNPTAQEQAQRAQAQSEIIEAQNTLARKKQEQQEIINQQQNIIEQDGAKKELTTCLMQNHEVKRNSAGVPVACLSAAYNHAMASGCEQAQKDIRTFNAIVPLQTSSSWWPFKKA